MNQLLTANKPGKVMVPDDKAFDLLKKTLPREVRGNLQMDAARLIRKVPLNANNIKDENYQGLVFLVNSNQLTEVVTAEGFSDPVYGNQLFFQTTIGTQREKDILDYIKNFGKSRTEAEQVIKLEGNPNDVTNTLGWTFEPKTSPTGHLRILITDSTGAASSVSEEQAVVTMGHELFGHGLLFRKGKPWDHLHVADSVFNEIEKRTLKNYKS